MDRKLLVAAVLVAAILPLGCASAEAKLQERYAEGLRPYSILGIEQAGLTVVWEQDLNLPASENESEIREVWLYRDALLASGDDGFLYSFDRLTGSPQWLVNLPLPPAHEPYLYDGVYYGVTGTRFFRINPAGALEIDGKFPISITAPFVTTGEYVYVPSGPGELHKLDIDKLSEVWPAPARTAGSIVTRPVVMGPYVVLGNSAGEIEAVDMVTSGRQARFRARDGITGVTVDENHIYAGSLDFYVYCISVNGTLRWKTIVGAPVSGAPMLSGDVLYVSVLGKGLKALDKQTGDLLWQNPGATQLIAAGGGNLFARGDEDELWVLDAENGRTRERLHVGSFDLVPINPFNDGLVYLVTREGRLVCLRAL